MPNFIFRLSMRQTSWMRANISTTWILEPDELQSFDFWMISIVLLFQHESICSYRWDEHHFLWINFEKEQYYTRYFATKILFFPITYYNWNNYYFVRLNDTYVQSHEFKHYRNESKSSIKCECWLSLAALFSYIFIFRPHTINWKWWIFHRKLTHFNYRPITLHNISVLIHLQQLF